MRNQGIGSWPARRARRAPDRTAILHEGRRIDYRELHERVVRLANGLRTLGISRGDRVAYLGANHPAFLETLFATSLLGAVFVPLNTRLTASELAYNLLHSGSHVLVHAEEHTESVAELRSTTQVRHVLSLTPEPGGDSAYEALVQGAATTPVDAPVGLDDPCLIMYTSGTTGRPKGAVLTHGNITWNCLNLLVDLDIGSDERSLVSAPMFHAAALNLVCLPTLLKGGTVLLESAFAPDRTLDVIEQERVTFVFGVPTMYEAVAGAKRWESADLSSLRTVLCGGAPIPDRVIRTYLDRGLPFVQGYGLTETSPCSTVLDTARSVTKAGSVGVANFFADLRLIRPDGSEAAPGEQGEIQVEGANVMWGYWENPEATEAVRPDGRWLRTGDVGVRDEDGFLVVVDRIKNMFISGGENVYPAEIEDVLHGHPAVAECAIAPMPDATWGEVGCAVVVLRPGTTAPESELLGFLRERLAGYKVPKTVRFVASLPRNPLGKTLRHQLLDVPSTPKESPWPSTPTPSTN